MCDGVSAAAAITAGLAAVGGTMQYKASQQQATASAGAQLDETRRQGEIMRRNQGIQQQQREDAKTSRKRFQQETLPAFTREGLDADQATESTRLQAALNTAGQRALTPTTSDAAAGNSSVVTGGGGPSAPSNNTQAFQSALSQQLGYASDFGSRQARAQAAMAALTRAQQLGGERLQNAGTAITLSNAKGGVLNRALGANGLFSNASGQFYQSEADRAANKGASMALLGSSLSTLGNAGYSYGTRTN